MQYIYLGTHNDIFTAQNLDSLRNEYGCVAVEVIPSTFTFITSVRLMNARKHAPEARAIVITEARNIVSALSLRKMGDDIHIIYAPASKSLPDVPHRMLPEIINGIDRVVFSSEREKREYLKRFPELSGKSEVFAKSEDLPKYNQPVLLRTGEITDADNLREVIDWVRVTYPGSKLIVAGTGKAGRVMPVVKDSRNFTDISIEWVGTNLIDSTVTQADALVQADWVASGREQALCAVGKTLLNPFENRASRACFHVEQWAKLLKSI